VWRVGVQGRALARHEGHTKRKLKEKEIESKEKNTINWHKGKE